MNFFIYSRKSVASARGESIENQIEMCKKYIYSRFEDAENTTVTVYEDEGFSAKSTSRPQFLKMIEDMKLYKPDCVICYRLDRISRNVGDFSAFIEQLNSMNIAFICINEDFDTSKPMGKAMMYITSVFAQLERETIAERVRDNMLMLAKTGRWLGGSTPLGFKSVLISDNTDGKQKCAYYLEEKGDEINTVKFIFENFIEKRKYSEVCKLLSENGLKNRNQKEFSAAAVKQILKNPVYCFADSEAFTYFKKLNAQVCFEKSESEFGLSVYNKRNYSRKNFKKQDEQNWIVAKGNHTGVISGKDWIKVQNIIRKNSRKSTVYNDYSLLSGILYCKKCGSIMIAKRRFTKGKELLFDYICSKKLKETKNACNNINLAGHRADETLFSSLMPYITHDNKDPEGFSDIQKRKIINLAVLKAVWDGEQIEVFLK